MTLTCAKCRTERPSIEMARVWVKDGWFPLCHPVDSVGPTCYSTYQHGHAQHGAPTTMLVDRRGRA